MGLREGRDCMKKLFVACIVLAAICIAALFCACADFSDIAGGGGNSGKTDLSSPLIGYRLTSDPDPVYDGMPKTRAFVITYDGGRVAQSAGISDDNFDIEYSDNINAGTATAVVTAKSSSAFKGSMTINFEILPSDEMMTVLTTAQLQSYASSGNYSDVRLGADITVAEGESIEISSVCTLSFAGFNFVNNGSVSNAGKIVITQKEGGEKYETYNCGTFSNTGRITMDDDTAFFNSGKFENSGQISFSTKSSGFYSDTEVVNSGFMSECYVRRPITEDNVKLSGTSVQYTGVEIKPEVEVRSDGQIISSSGEYEVSYLNNINVGEATVTIIAEKYSKHFTGEHTMKFTIVRSQVVVVTQSALESALNGGNYDRITIGSSLKSISCDLFVADYITLVVQADNLKSTGCITVEGTLELQSNFTQSGTFINDGNVKNTGVMYNEGQFVNNSQFVNEGKIYNKGSFENCGQMSCTGDIFNYDTAQLMSDSVVEIEGNLYADEPQTMFTGGVVVRQQLTADDVSLRKSSEVYDGKMKLPIVVFSQQNVDVGYRVSYELTDGTPVEDRIVDADNYNVVIAFNGMSETYKGSIKLPYTIERAPYEISSVSDFFVLDNKNYGELTVVSDMEITSEIFIAFYQKLTIAEGVNIVNKTDYFVVAGQLVNNGTLVNYGAENYIIRRGADASMVNNGTLYLNAEEDGIEGEGTVYVRRDISLVQSVNPTPFVEYSGYDTPKPQIQLYDGTYVLTNEDYSVRYENWNEISVPDNNARIISVADTYSKRYFGVRTDEYEVRPGSIEVATESELFAALGDLREGTQLCNYGNVVMTNDITAVNDTYNTITVTIYSNTTLNIGEYKLTLRDGEKYRGFDVKNFGEIVISRQNTLRNSSNYSGSGKVVAYVSGSDDVYEFVNCVDVMRLSADIEGSVTLYPYSNFAKEFDLCGHSIGALTVNASWSDILITSSVGGAAIGMDGQPTAALRIDGVGADKSVKLENLTIYGISYADEGVAAGVQTDATCNVVPVA